MGYYLSEYLNELYNEEINSTRKLGKYKIISYIDENDEKFRIITFCEELQLKHTEYLGVDIKLSAFPNYYKEINECFEEIAKEIFSICNHKNKKEIDSSDIYEIEYECSDCGINYIYYPEFKGSTISKFNWN